MNRINDSQQRFCLLTVVFLTVFFISPGMVIALEVEESEQETTLNTDLYSVKFANKGGGITSFKLIEPKYGLDLVRVPAKGGPVCLSLLSPDSPGDSFMCESILDEDSVFPVEIDVQGEEASITFGYTIHQTFKKGKNGIIKFGGAPQDIVIKKTYRFTNGAYRFAFSLSISVPPEQEKTAGSFVFGWFPGLESEQPIVDNPSLDDKPGYLDKTKFDDVKPGAEGQFKVIDQKSRLLGMNDTYYAAVFIPRKPLPDANLVVWRAPETKKDILAGVKTPDFELVGGEETVFEYEGYIGPKEEHRLTGELTCLRQQGKIVPHILRLLKYLHSLTNSWGWSIILLTILIRLVLLPLTIKQAQNMAKMQAIQPELNEVRNRFKDNPQMMNQETIRLYKEKQVNPLGGCLPAFVQIPILFALFWALRNSIDLKGSAFLWIPDLSIASKYFTRLGYTYLTALLLPTLTALTAFWQQKQMSTNPQQSKMMAFFPVMMFFFSWTLPSGVVLYWFVSNLLSTVQQKIINSKMTPSAATVLPSVALGKQPKNQNNQESEKKENIGDAHPSSNEYSEESPQKEEPPAKKKRRKRRKKK